LADVTHVLDIQLDKWSSREKLGFTVNLGVFVEQVWRVVWDKPVDETIQEVNCFPRLRIGQLIGPGPLHKDVSWTIDATTDIDLVGAELQGILVDKGLPFLDKLDSISAALAVAEDPMLRRLPAERLYYAVLKHLSGAPAEAQGVLNDMLRRGTAWEDRVRAVSERLARLG
jgi:hypothetical protein